MWDDLSSERKAQLRPACKDIADKLFDILKILDGDEATLKDIANKAVFAAKVLYQNPITNPPDGDDLGFEEIRKRFLHNMVTVPGTFEHRFKEMLRDSSEEGAMKWMARHWSEFPKDERLKIAEGIHDYSLKHRSFNEWLRTDFEREWKAAGLTVFTSGAWNMLR